MNYEKYENYPNVAQHVWLRERKLFPRLVAMSTVIEDTTYRKVMHHINNHGLPMTIVYLQRLTSFGKKYHTCFYEVVGTLSTDPFSAEGLEPLDFTKIHPDVWRQLFRKMLRSYYKGVISYFVLKHGPHFLSKPIYPSGRIGYEVRKGLEGCRIDASIDREDA